MCSLGFENNLLTIEGVRFDIEENTIIEAFVRFRFASVAITTYESGIGACTEHTHQVLIHAQSAVPLKHAEHTHQELIPTLSICIRN